jgi:hypothetical protein
MKNLKSGTWMRLTDEQLEGSVRTATTQIERGIKGLVRQK